MEPPALESNRTAKKRVRTISTLTEEQVRKKRGNDRDAQRAFRERTRSRIQNLEEELETLRSQHDVEVSSIAKELQDMRHANQGLEAQLRKIREITNVVAGGEEGLVEHSITVELPDQESLRMAGETAADGDFAHGTMVDGGNSSTSEIQTHVHSVNQDIPRGASIRHGPIYPEISDPSTRSEAPHQQANILDGTNYDGHHPTTDSEGFNNNSQIHPRLRTDHYHHSSSPNSENPPQFTNHLQSDLQPIATTPRQTHDGSVENAEYMHDTFLQGSYQYSPGAAVHQTYHGATSPISGDPNWPKSPDKQHSQTSHKTTPNADEYLDGVITAPQPTPTTSLLPHTSSMSPVAAISPQWVQPGSIEQISKYTILPRHIAATCPLDQILLDFLSSRRLLAAQGTLLNTLIGPLKPSVSGLLDPRRRTEAHAASRVMVDVVATFPDTNLREQLGFVYIMYATMRWQIASDRESFDNLPSWLHPTVLQVMVPHAAWIDNIPWPNARDLLIQNPVKYPFRDFSEMYARYVRLKWPFDVEDALMPKVDSNSDVLLNPLFEKQVRRLDCWSIEEPFKERFPELAAAMKSSQ